MLKVKDGDLGRLGLLFERYKKILFSFFYQMNHDASLSEDLIQNVFIRILKYKDSFKGDGEFKVWMFHIARNVYRDNYRKNKMKNTEDIDAWRNHLNDNALSKEGEIEKTEELQLLSMAMGRLDMEKREVLTLAKLEGLKYKQISDILKCTEGAVKVKVFRALQDLKKEYIHLQNTV